MLWNSSMPCFSPDGQRIAWSADNWTHENWQGNEPTDRPYLNSFWKPDFGQGSHHHIWTCELDDMDDDHCYFPPSYWGYATPNPSQYTHHYDMHYNPSWDWLEPQE
jgi:hypothetical protein